jgi:hypothetical protein
MTKAVISFMIKSFAWRIDDSCGIIEDCRIVGSWKHMLWGWFFLVSGGGSIIYDLTRTLEIVLMMKRVLNSSNQPEISALPATPQSCESISKPIFDNNSMAEDESPD